MCGSYCSRTDKTCKRYALQGLDVMKAALTKDLLFTINVQKLQKNVKNTSQHLHRLLGPVSDVQRRKLTIRS